MKTIFLLLFALPVVSFAQSKKNAIKKPIPVKPPAQALMERGRTVYSAYCLSCHQIDGSGVPDLNPPLIQNNWVLGPKSILIQQVLKGSSGKVEIDGETFRNTMPPQPFLTDTQIADVLTFIRNSFGNQASAVSPVEVKSLRAKTK